VAVDETGTNKPVPGSDHFSSKPPTNMASIPEAKLRTAGGIADQRFSERVKDVL
jgi:hypothetical protein